MGAAEVSPSTGLPGLDRILEGLWEGDNVVWQVGAIEDYLPFVRPYFEEAVRQKRKFVYFHFERHVELIPPHPGVEMHRLDPSVGFETLTAEIARCTREGVKEMIKQAFRAEVPGVILSREYTEMNLDNLSGVGDAIRELRLRT